MFFSLRVKELQSRHCEVTTVWIHGLKTLQRHSGGGTNADTEHLLKNSVR